MNKITKILPQNYTNLLQKIPSNERAAKLLDLLMTRTVAGFKKFVDVLEVTGHHFLSDCLREAGEFKKQVDRRWCLHAVHAGHQYSRAGVSHNAFFWNSQACTLNKSR